MQKNQAGRRFVPISFVHMDSHLGKSLPSLIQLNEKLHPDYLERTLIHELGHVIGWSLLNPIDRSEVWAEAFRHWVNAGQPEDHYVWYRLEPVLGL